MEFSMKIWIVAMNGRWTNDDDDSDEDRAMHAYMHWGVIPEMHFLITWYSDDIHTI